MEIEMKCEICGGEKFDFEESKGEYSCHDCGCVYNDITSFGSFSPINNLDGIFLSSK